MRAFGFVRSRGAAVALLGALAAGCGNGFDHLEFVPKTMTPIPVAVTYGQIEIPTGIAVAFTATPMDGDRKLPNDVQVELTSTDLNVVGLDRGSEPRDFVLYGVGAGMAKIMVDIDGDREGAIPVTVLAQ